MVPESLLIVIVKPLLISDTGAAHKTVKEDLQVLVGNKNRESNSEEYRSLEYRIEDPGITNSSSGSRPRQTVSNGQEQAS